VERNDGDVIRLTVPATSAAVRIARVGAAGLGTRLGFTFTEVEELRLAVGEAAAQLCDTSTDVGSGLDLLVSYGIEPGGLRVTLALYADADDSKAVIPAFSDLAATVLDTMVDEWHLDPDAGRVELRKSPADHDD
jgi:serine/threonine-protein kinase RsbW